MGFGCKRKISKLAFLYTVPCSLCEKFISPLYFFAFYALLHIPNFIAVRK